MAFHPFFENDTYVIDQKIQYFKFANLYRVYNAGGVEIGGIQEIVPGWVKFLRVLLNKSMLPFQLEIKDLEGNVLSTVKRGFTFWLSKITIADGVGTELAQIKQKYSVLKPKFALMSPAGAALGTIKGDWRGWNFQITAPDEHQIGTISKKWNGAMKEIFTTADKYIVEIDPSVNEDAEKVALVSTAITIDMVLKDA